MKLVSELFQETLEFNEGEVLSLVIENQKLMLDFLKKLYSQINGEDGDIVLSKDNEIMKIQKMVELITTFVPFEINEKRLLTKINGLLEKEAVNEIYYNKTMLLLSEIERYVNDLSDFFPYSFEYQGINAASLIKMCGINICDDSINDVERVINYMSIVQDLLGEKLFVFVNMSLFFEHKDLQSFIDTVNAYKYNVLLIDGVETVKLSGIRRLIIDKDLCII